MRLTVLHPEMKLLIAEFAGGLMPLRLADDEQFSLVIKTQKEAILAAKIHGGLSFYLPALPSSTVITTSLITAFFDDDDAPLTIRTPLFGDDGFSRGIIEILKYEEVDIYFFDEHNYEWMSFRAILEDNGSCLVGDEEIHLLAYHRETVKSIHSVLNDWFANRTRGDDECTIQAVFKEELSPQDIFVLDMTPQVNGYQGSSGYRRDTLTRTDPGYHQERDISACLLRAFKPQQIIMNPRRKDTFKEILDHLVLTDELAILIQAKDSPTTEAGITRTIDRKRRSTHSQIDDAIRQINGAARYLSRETTAKLVVADNDLDVSLEKLEVIGLAIVKELFDDEGEAYATACKKLSVLNGGGMVMDYNSFHAFTHRFRSEVEFVRALKTLVARVKSGRWIRVKDEVFDGVLDWVEQVRTGDPD
ncbi:hypothetical protein EJ076_25940 [Mesorhizobium sp. M7D.F.Ca.US.005.01.1.1]|uniref:hypothetical protein n=1 Tax=Mesorhizobium sp. M7D.F.Ca.US.005.01.1.1 TaxID=2493678 RepID=UPI000F74CE05|nr:hypothetical protein [Mesorhizobium sp. M7D.F.Ca.US.005.01.1.1]AZO44294.1 hypothetical protein EJ076_25940 [Mesorhizobium sp. M7D.F.Ca.US.005.01.1.1]